MPSDNLSAIGWNDRVEALCADVEEPLRPGRVARVDRGRALVVTDRGPEPLDHPRAFVAGIVTGDWVLVSRSADHLVGVGLLPRWSALRRAGASGDDQMLAANVDVVGITQPLDRGVNPGLIDRLVTLVWDAGARPVVVLTKADLGDVAAATQAAETAAPAVDVLATSASTGQGVDGLRALAPPGTTLALVGASGAGKSMLTNALAGREVQRIGEVRSTDLRGRHTTTARELVPLPGGGVLLDTPGLRAVGLPGAAAESVDRTFSDIDALAAACRYGDCSHEAEPGCAVLAAIAKGVVDVQRLERYRKLQREAAHADLRADVRARREAERAWGRKAKAILELKRRSGGRDG
jgi:ribosome biogenesis GTPase / thiamine phosphate phosphatase